MLGIILLLHILGASVWTGGHLILAAVILPRALKHRDVEGIRSFESAYEKIGIPALQRRFDGGDRIACFNAGDFEFGARRVDGHVDCAIGDLPRRKIKSLLASVETR